MNAQQRRAAAELCAKPIGLSQRSACRHLLLPGLADLNQFKSIDFFVKKITCMV